MKTFLSSSASYSLPQSLNADLGVYVYFGDQRLWQSPRAPVVDRHRRPVSKSILHARNSAIGGDYLFYYFFHIRHRRLFDAQLKRLVLIMSTHLV
jgi:hypothetical protein